jgi:hypothetical protein
MPLFKKKSRKGIQILILNSVLEKAISNVITPNLMRAKIPLMKRKNIEDQKREELTLS